MGEGMGCHLKYSKTLGIYNQQAWGMENLFREQGWRDSH